MKLVFALLFAFALAMPVSAPAFVRAPVLKSGPTMPPPACCPGCPFGDGCMF
jgi:hypothetical protein